MPRLFSYGSLQQPAVQLATFGRLPAGSRDALAGFELQDLRHGDKQLANVIRSDRADSRVEGTVFEVTDAELAAADGYERGDAYTRIQAVLASGGEAWVYVEAASIGLHSRSHGNRR
jgi:gamma-glutamylcyclotransferase (GGCT)/AIG2-like uncharacterized protein YtfP